LIAQSTLFRGFKCKYRTSIVFVLGWFEKIALYVSVLALLSHLNYLNQYFSPTAPKSLEYLMVILMMVPFAIWKLQIF
jgi:hypothetical protein